MCAAMKFVRGIDLNIFPKSSKNIQLLDFFKY